MPYLVFKWIIILAVLFQASKSVPTGTPTPPTCNGTITINPPNDLTKPYYWPSGWNENMNPPSHYINLRCSFIFNVPNGLYAKLVMKGKVDGSAYISLSDGSLYPEFVHDPNLEPYFFVSNSFNVTMFSKQNATTGTLGIKVLWSNFPSVPPTKTRISNGTVQVQKTYDSRYGSVFTTDAGSRISLVPAPTNTQKLNQTLLRNIFIFDGPSYHSKYAGDFYTILKSRDQYVSTGNTLTIYAFEPLNNEDLYVVQDYRDTKQFYTYTSVFCDGSGMCHALLDSYYGKSAVISVSMGSETLTSGNLEIGGVLSVYSGVVADSNLLNTYDYTTIKTNLPHKYTVHIRQYVYVFGVGTIFLSQE